MTAHVVRGFARVAFATMKMLWEDAVLIICQNLRASIRFYTHGIFTIRMYQKRALYYVSYGILADLSCLGCTSDLTHNEITVSDDAQEGSLLLYSVCLSASTPPGCFSAGRQPQSWQVPWRWETVDLDFVDVVVSFCVFMDFAVSSCLGENSLCLLFGCTVISLHSFSSAFMFLIHATFVMCVRVCMCVHVVVGAQHSQSHIYFFFIIHITTKKTYYLQLSVYNSSTEISSKV